MTADERAKQFYRISVINKITEVLLIVDPQNQLHWGGLNYDKLMKYAAERLGEETIDTLPPLQPYEFKEHKRN